MGHPGLHHTGGILTSPSISTLDDDDPSLTPLPKKRMAQNLRERSYGVLGVGPSGRPPRLQTNWKRRGRGRRPITRHGFSCSHQRTTKDSLPKWNRSTTRNCVIFTWHWTKMAHASLLLANSASPKQRIPHDAAGGYHRSTFVVDSIESLYTLKEEASENVEPPTKHSLALEENKVIPFVEAFKHKIGEEEKESQDHYATIPKFKCPDNLNHVVQSMSLPTTR